MKSYHVQKQVYKTVFTYTKPNVTEGVITMDGGNKIYFDGYLERKSYYFSICDWNGYELGGFYSESEMLDAYETRFADDDVQIFVYPLVDGEEIHPYGKPVQKENYVFNY